MRIQIARITKVLSKKVKRIINKCLKIDLTTYHMLKVSRKMVSRLPRKIMRAKVIIQIRKNHALILDTKDTRIIKAGKNIVSLCPKWLTKLATLLQANVPLKMKIHSYKIIKAKTNATHKTRTQSYKVNSGNKFNILTISRILNSKFLKKKDKEKVTFLIRTTMRILSKILVNLLPQILPMGLTF
jgi:hypothetical protein